MGRIQKGSRDFYHPPQERWQEGNDMPVYWQWIAYFRLARLERVQPDRLRIAISYGHIFVFPFPIFRRNARSGCPRQLIGNKGGFFHSSFSAQSLSKIPSAKVAPEMGSAIKKHGLPDLKSCEFHSLLFCPAFPYPPRFLFFEVMKPGKRSLAQ